MNSKKHYPWKRFWCPKEGRYFLDKMGYLLDPEDEFGRINQPDVIGEESFTKTPCLALLGEPGMGKTEVLQEFLSKRRMKTGADCDLLYLDLRSYGEEGRLYNSIFRSDEFASWINSNRVLEIVLDSLDECMIYLKTVAPMLIEELRKYPLSRLHLRIACRISEWPILLHRELPKIWGTGNYGEYELVPLRQQDIVAAALEENLDSDAFLKTLEERRMAPFANKPITLIMLLKQYQQSGSLDDNQEDLYHSYCLHLCRDFNPFRRDIKAVGQLEPSLRLAVAERIAAITMFCKRANIYTGPDETGAIPHEDVTISDMAGGMESESGRNVLITESNLYEVLGTGLFSGWKEERFVWGHWTYAEYLAARFIIRHGVALDQIKDLIFIRQEFDEEGGRVVPQLKETAAWMAAMHRPLFDEIMKSDPQILLRSPIASSDFALRKSLTVSLLRMGNEEKLTDFDLRQSYKVLSHPELSSQLLPYIKDKTKGFLVRRMAIDIAEACGSRELITDLIGVALDESDNTHIRIQAADAIVQIGDPFSKERLRPLLNAGDADKDDELKGCALKALWPDHLNAEELFSYIAKPKRENLFGLYKLFILQDLIPNLSIEILSAALAWVQGLPKLGAGEITILRDLTSEIMYKAWENLEIEEILNIFAEIAITRIENYEPIIGERFHGKTEPGKLDDPSRRHRLIKAIHLKLEESQISSVWGSLEIAGVVSRDDFGWLMEQLLTCESEKDQILWAKLVQMVFDWSPGEMEEVWKAKEFIPALEKEFVPIFSPIELDSDRARRLRKISEREIRTKKKQIEELPRPSLKEILLKRLEKIESGDTESWWILTLEMTCELRGEKYIYGEELQSDITATPGWKVINDPTRARVVEAAYNYVMQGEPHTDQWFGKNTFHRPAAAGYKALLLLQKLAPERLNELNDEIWSKWAPIVLAYPESSGMDAEEPMKNLVAKTYHHASNSTIKSLLALIDKENEDHAYIFVLRKMDKTWDEQLERAILEKAKDIKLKPNAAASLIERLFEKGKFNDEIQKLSAGFLEQRNQSKEKAIECGALLLIYGGEKGWEIVREVFEKEPDFGSELIAEVARRHDHAGSIVRRLTEKSVADLYVWIAGKFPHCEDPDIDGAHAVSTRESIGHFRDALLTGLREKGTAEAVTSIREIARRMPNLSWVKFTAVEAQQVAMRKIWSGISPKEILNLVRNNDNRLVDSEAQLLEVVIGSLKRYQDTFLGEKPAVYDLWNTNDWTPKEESFISDHVARHLENDLKSREIVINREVQIRKGEETDIHVVAIREMPDGAKDQVKLVIEVKGCWHQDLKKAMQVQLRDRYLRENKCKHGLYLVAWFLCTKWRGDDSRKERTPKWTLEEAQDFFDHQAKDLSESGKILRAFVLDAKLR